MAQEDPRRHLASVSALLEDARLKTLAVMYGRPVVIDAIHAAQALCREALTRGECAPDLDAQIAVVVREITVRERDRLRSVVNATGILLHTGLGRAVLAPRAVSALANLIHCCNLQIDLDTGLRGKRNFTSEQLLCRLTGAEAAMIVNNNAAATYLILAALCDGKEVIVSRGQLIEIGGSFRLPDCVTQSGAQLIEVGTTNKTHLRDYAQALSENTGAVLRVNPSNYRIVGFTKEVSTRELVELKQKQDVLIIDDLGCGALIDLRNFGLPHEPTVQESVAAGADLVCFSGDKLIGGPQSGIIIGKKALIQRIRKHPLTRMLRVDKLTDLALEYTLRLFLDPETLPETNPTIAMLAVSQEELRRRAQELAKRVTMSNSGLQAVVAETDSAMGGGALPGTAIPSYGLAVTHPKLTADAISALLRRHEPPIIARIEEDRVMIDMRTLLEGEDALVCEALLEIAHGV